MHNFKKLIKLEQIPYRTASRHSSTFPARLCLQQMKHRERNIEKKKIEQNTGNWIIIQTSIARLFNAEMILQRTDLKVIVTVTAPEARLPLPELTARVNGPS